MNKLYRKYTLLFLIITALTLVTPAQEKAKLNSWRGLILNETNIEQAKEILNQPTKEEKAKSLKTLTGSQWFDIKKTKFTKLSYKNLEGFDGSELYFLDDILVAIELELKDALPSASLIDAYENKFFPLVGNHLGMSPAELMDDSRPIIYPEDGFPLQYYLASANDEVIGLAFAAIGFKQRMKYLGATTIPAKTMPGEIKKIQLISRRLESKKKIELLK
jgi:hypothetical protein